LKQPIPFGKYFLLDRINVGGMAEVFRAKTTGVEGFERLVAVKRILPGIAEDEEFVTMFVDEAKIAVQLTHANIAQIFDLGRADGSFYIALEYIHGKDLRAIANRVRQRGEQLPVAFACYVIMKACEGLDYAHNKYDGAGRFLKLVHRDVSPQNILVSYEGEVKIVDFGIAKAAGKVGRTQAGILKGKFGYMSPEQIQGLEIDRRSDVFGVGICLYELLTGERLFAAETDFATLEKVKAGVIIPPSSYNPRVPEELDQIVLRALAKDRDARFESALALHDALQAYSHTSGSLFGRKDLGLYMHRVFGDEIEKENAREEAYARIEPSPAESPRAMGNGHAQAHAHAHAHAMQNPFDDEDEESERAENERVARAYAVNAKIAAKAHAPAAADVRKRTGTLLGVPYTALRVPRPVPNPASIPPLKGGGPSARPAEPSRPSLQAVAPELAHAMDWDDEELSTQIYDKPELDDAFDDTSDPDREEGDHDEDDAHGAHGAHDELDALQASVPDSMEPGEGLVRANFTGHKQVFPARTSDPGPQPLRLAPPPAASTREQQPTLMLTEAVPPVRGRPMLAAVVAVLSIIALIVLGLVAFRSNDPATVSLSTRPTRVEVSVDGRALGSSMSPFVIGELTPDRPHEITVSSAGHAPWTKVVTLTSGQVMTMSDIVLEPLETGFVLVTEPPSATVFIDDRLMPGRTPLRVADLRAGEHHVRVELSGYASWESTLSVNKGTVLPLPTIHLATLPNTAPPSEASARVARRGGFPAERERDRERPSSEERASAREPKPAPPPRVVAPAEPPAVENTAEAPEPEPETEEPKTKAPETEEPALAQVAPVEKDKVEEVAEEPARVVEAQTGKLRVNSRPWSQVFIDGKSYGATPRLNIELTVGSHTLRLVNDEFKIEKVEQIEIVAGETRSVIVNLLEK
jgi:serine/threonine protein kinase